MRDLTSKDPARREVGSWNLELKWKSHSEHWPWDPRLREQCRVNMQGNCGKFTSSLHLQSGLEHSSPNSEVFTTERITRGIQGFVAVLHGLDDACRHSAVETQDP